MKTLSDLKDDDIRLVLVGNYLVHEDTMRVALTAYAVNGHTLLAEINAGPGYYMPRTDAVSLLRVMADALERWDGKVTEATEAKAKWGGPRLDGSITKYAE